jgi:CelD/BcsL family acetyltransferase involved in cellulose biosynthesis
MNTTAEFLDSPEISDLQCEVLTDFASLEPVRSQWQRLWEADPVAEIFQSFPWCRAWWQGYGAGRQLHCIVVRHRELIVGILPLVREDRTFHFLGALQADYGDILCEEQNAGAVLTAALGTLLASHDWKECVLDHLSENSRLVRNLGKVPARLRRNLRLVAAGHAPTIMVGKEPGILGSLAAKKHLRRHENKLAKSGGISFRFLPAREEIRRHLPAFFQHQIRRRILHGQQSSCLQPEFSSFLRSLVEELDPARHLRFGILEWGGRPLAYHIGFLANGKFTMYQQAFDVDAWDHSPGEVLLRQLFLYAEQSVSREFDFSVGEEPYKARFASHFKANFTLYIEPASLSGRVRRSYHAVNGKFGDFRRSLKAMVRSNTAAYSWAKQARRWTGEALARISRRLSLLNPFSRTEDGSHRGARLRSLSPPNSPALESDVQLSKGRLSDLADLYHESPNFRLSSRLTEYRERLRRGDTVFILRVQGRPALIAWTASEGAAEAKSSDQVGSNLPYDCTFLHRRRKAAYRTLVTLLASQNHASQE